MSEIIEASERFIARGGVHDRMGQVEQSLRDRARLPRPDRERMAANLGALAAEIEPDNPVEGARRMFERLGKDWDSKWRKRKRLLLLKGERPPREDVLQSSGATFLALARAAGDLQAEGQGAAMAERSRRAAVRKLLAGTTFAPAAPPVSETLAQGKELLSEALSRVARRTVKVSGIGELWSVLDNTPFGVGLVDEETGEQVQASPLGASQLLASEISHHLFRRAGRAKFDPSDRDTDWSLPSIRIGVLAKLCRLRMFRVAADAAELFVYDDEISGLAEPAEDWLDEHGFEWRAESPDVRYSEATGYGWEDRDFWQLYGVWLTLEGGPDESGAFEVAMVDRETMTEVVPYQGWHNTQMLERAVLEPHAFMDWGACPNIPTPLAGVRLPTWWSGGVGRPGQFLGYVRDSLDPPNGSRGAVDEPDVSPYLVTDENLWFFPFFPIDADLPVPLPQRSIGAAILRNLANCDGPDRLDNRFLEIAQAIARTGMKFHEEVVEYYRGRLFKD